MSTSKGSAYHHGDLKVALLDAAQALLDEGGVSAVSLREAARRAGVSPTASYRHFADKEALLGALAARGFEAFAKAMQQAGRKSTDPFSAMGRAYVRFAVSRPGMFRLMFGPAVADRHRSPELIAAVAQATQVLDQGMKTRKDITGNAEVAALRSWSMVHGLSMLVLDGMLPGYDPDRLARAITSYPQPLN
jgi:AcrR family transcriptional regulator